MTDATAYDDCDFTDATKIASMSVGGSVDVAAPDAPTTRYYVCTVGSHCDSGLKIAITWAPLPTDASVAPTPAPAGDLSNPTPTAASVPSPTAQSVVIASQLVLEEVYVGLDTATPLEGVIKAALVTTLSSISSTDDIVAFSAVASRRRRLQSTFTVSFSVRVAAATLASDVATELAAAAQNGALNTQLAIAADAASVSPPTAPADANTYDTIMAAVAAPTPAPIHGPAPRPSYELTAVPSNKTPTYVPTSKLTASPVVPPPTFVSASSLTSTNTTRICYRHAPGRRETRVDGVEAGGLSFPCLYPQSPRFSTHTQVYAYDLAPDGGPDAELRADDFAPDGGPAAKLRA